MGRKEYKHRSYKMQKKGKSKTRSYHYGVLGSQMDPHHGKGPYQGKVVDGEYKNFPLEEYLKQNRKTVDEYNSERDKFKEQTRRKKKMEGLGEGIY